MKSRCLVIAGVSFFLVCFVYYSAGLCAPQAQKVLFSTPVSKDIEGEVTWVSENRIAIVYSANADRTSEEEIMLPFDPKTIELGHVRSMSQIEPGDRVHIRYEEALEETLGVKRPTRRIKAISLIKKAAVTMPVMPEAVPQAAQENTAE